MILNPAFSNPSGHTYKTSQKKSIAALLKKYHITLIEDDVFAELGKNETRPRTIHSFDTEGYVILCSSFSKTLSQDIRIGWMSAGKFFKQARTYKYVSTLGTPTLQQYALTHYLSIHSFERHLRYISLEYSKKQQIFLKIVKRYFPVRIKVSQPDGGYLCWLKLYPFKIWIYTTRKDGRGSFKASRYHEKNINYYMPLILSKNLTKKFTLLNYFKKHIDIFSKTIR